MIKFINSPEFKSLYGSYYVIPKRLNQDIVESFFSLQRQACGGSNNMTASVYGYNVNGRISYSDAKLLSKKQTNVNETELSDINDLQSSPASLPKRKNGQSIFTSTSNLWPLQL